MKAKGPWGLRKHSLRMQPSKITGAQTPLQLSTPTFRIRPWQPFGTVIIMWVKSQPPPIRHRAVCASRGRHEHVHVHKHRH